MIKENLVIRGKNCLEVNGDSLDSETYEFIDEAVKTLEQEPTDAVSRDAIIWKIVDMPKYADDTKIRSTRKLKEFLEKEYPEDTFEVTPDMSIGFTLALEYIMEFIHDLPPVIPTQKWTPVSEGLPKEGETVLVCYKTPDGIAQSVCEWFDMPNRGIVWSTLCGRTPIAWMPKPKDYAGEEQE